MDGENDGTQNGQLAAAAQAANAQADGNTQDASGDTSATQEVTAADNENQINTETGDEDIPDYEAQIAERDARITELEGQLVDQRIEHELACAGCRSTRAARALLDEYDGDVTALKAAEPWLFNDAADVNQSSAPPESGTTGLKPAGADTAASAVARWERLAGITDSEDKE